MSFGCYVDIYQQDGTPVRMHYAKVDKDTVKAVTWIGIQEETAQKFRSEPLSTSTSAFTPARPLTG